MTNHPTLLRIMFAILVLVIGFAVPANAQEKKVGLVVGYPTTAGVQWQVSDRVAVRADAGFGFGLADSVTASLSFGGVTSSSTTRFRHSTVEMGVSGLVTLAKRDQLRLYAAPRLAWHRLHSSFSTDITTLILSNSIALPTSPRESSTTTNGAVVDAMFGASYRLGDRFAVFGEAGISYVRPTATSSDRGSTSTSYSVGSRSSVGIVIFF